MMVQLYQQNAMEVYRLQPDKFQCKHSWWNLFQIDEKSIRREVVRFDLIRRNSLGQIKRIPCNKNRLPKFRRMLQVLKTVRYYQKRLEQLNEAFQNFLEFYKLGARRLELTKELLISTAIDAFLRGEPLEFSAPIRVNGRQISGREFFSQWLRQKRAYAWGEMIETMSERGVILNRRGKVRYKKSLSLLDTPFTVYRTRTRGQIYLIRPQAILNSKFAIVLDRSKGVIEVLSSSERLENPQSKLFKLTQTSPASRPNTQMEKERSARKRLGELLSQMVICPRNEHKNIIKNGEIYSIPTTSIELSPYSFKHRDGILWLRWNCNIFAIPLQVGQVKQLSPALLRTVVRLLESSLIEEDRIPKKAIVVWRGKRPVQLKVVY